MNTKISVISVITILFCGFSLYPLVKTARADGSPVSKWGKIQRNIIGHPDNYFGETKTPTFSSQKQGDLKEINWPELSLGTFIGWILGLFSVLIVDHLKEPNLVFEAGSIAEDKTNKWRFVHIKVKNLKRRYRFSPFTTSPAFACKAIVKIEDRSFIGRWTSKEQPIGHISNVINVALVHPREDIYPYTLEQEAVEISIGIKYEKENEFYGFNNESYLPAHLGFRNKEYQFGKGEFNGKVVISTLGKTYSQGFKIYNKSQSRQDFWLKLVGK